MGSVQSQVEELPENRVRLTVQVPSHDVHHDVELPATDDQDWQFTATVAVQAKPELPDWKELEVGAAELEVPEELVQAELDALRATVAELVPVEGRPVGPEDTVVVDLVSEDETRRDYVVDLGRGAVVEEVEQGLVGMSAGDTKEMSFELADGSAQSLTATVKEIKEKVLPPLDDDLARAATEFETFAELRADIESRLREQIEDEIETRFRADAADTLVAASKVDAAGPLVDSRTRELLRGFARQVESRGVQLETFLAMTGQQPEALVAQLRDEAQRSVARELVLDAVAEQLELDVPDAEVEELVREQAEALGDDSAEMLVALRESGRFESLREDLRLRQALDRVASEVKRIPLAQAEAREAIWTPDKENPPTETKLWTPDQPQSTEGARS